jgi:DNA gyrase subunit A|tara:strand:+ start:2925 stop:5342 length:2418 start_codon:yes stop_codon:yes gene_type:complete
MPETITPINIDDEMKSSYLDYAMSVIIGRALPDVRDGLKPVHRRVLFAMHETGNVSNKPYKKSARIVGDVMGKYHPHGDQAIYDTIVRMAQEFSLRHPLVDGQGNFGSIDGDSAAAMRYTEIRMEEITSELLRDLDKDTVQFTPNYDDSLQEPSVLPASFPQLLVNGSSGIAVGMATNIPPHNLNEVIDSAVHVIDNPDCTIEDLMELVLGPDFPTRGIIQGRSGIRAAYKTGRGIIRIRGRAEIETMEKGDRERIIINELPFQVNKARLVEKIAELVRDKRLEGISDLRDESDRDGLRVVVELKKGIMGQVVLNSLYKNTQLQDTFGVILLALVNQQPKVLNLKEFLYHFILFRKEVVTRRTEYDLNKAREKEHVLEGLAIALDNLDAVVQLIRKAADPASARDGLMAEFELSEIQAKAILEMRLQRLTGLERQKIIEDLEETRKRIKEFLNILAHEEVKLNIIKEELVEIKNKYGNERRTEIAETDEGDIDIEDLIADEDAVVVYTRSGYIKRQTVDNYRAQRRGGKGIRGMNLKEEDVVEKLFIASTLSHLLVFTSIGKIHWLRVFSIPDVSRIAKGKSIANLLRLQPGESIASILSVREFEEDKFVMVATERGIVKKTSLMAYSKPRQGGIIGLTIDKGDRVIGAELCDGESDILLATEKGFSIRFSEKEVRPIGRTGRGVRGIRLKKEDRVVGAEIVQPGNKFLTVTSKGYGKRTRMEEYPVQGRGGLGVMTIRCNEKTGTVVGVQQVEETDQLLVITSNGNIVRMRVNEISVIGRNTQGVRLVGIGEGNQVVSIEKLVE